MPTIAQFLPSIHLDALNTTSGQLLLGLLACVIVLFFVLSFAALALVFRKTGQPAWQAFIPVYNYIPFAKAAGLSGWWGALAFLIVPIPVLCIWFSIALARRFGCSLGMTLLLVLVPPLGLVILGLGEFKPRSLPMVPPTTLPKKGPRGAAPTAVATTASGRQSWHGGRLSQKQTKHRWQQSDWNEEQLADLRRREFYYRASLLAHWGAVCGLLGLFVYLLMVFQPKTLFYVIASTSYRRPLPPNSFAYEDGHSFVSMHLETLKWGDLSEDWRNKEMGLSRLRQKLVDAAENARRQNVMMLYVNMHGAVDGNNEACLLTTDCDPTNTETWQSVTVFLKQLHLLPPRMLKVVVFDATKQMTNWSIGMTYNGFADRLREAFNAAKVPNLVVINSAGSNEVSWAAPELRGSVFGHFFHRALSGEADLPAERGNGDRLIQISELENYLVHHVDQWVVRHRHDRQRPLVLRQDGLNFAAISCRSGAAVLPGDESSTLGPVSQSLAKAAKTTPLPSEIGSITTPQISGPHLSANGLSPPMISRPAFNMPFVATPGLTAQSYTFPVQLPAVTRSAAGGKGDKGDAAKPDVIGVYTGSDLNPDELDFLWGKRDQLAKQAVYSRSPLLWRQFEQELIRLELMMQSGAAYRGRIEKQMTGLHRLAAALGRPTTTEPAPALSLPLAIRYNQITDTPETVRQIALYLGAKSAGDPVHPAAVNRPSAALPSRDAARGGLGADQAAGAAGASSASESGQKTEGADSAGEKPAEAAGPALQAAEGKEPAAGDKPAADDKPPMDGDAKPAAAGAEPMGPQPMGPKPATPKVIAPTPPPAPSMPEGPTTYAGRALAAWYRFQEPVSSDAPAPSIRELLSFVGSPEAGQGPGFIEMHLLEMFARYLDVSAERRPKFELLQKAAAVRDMAEQASLPADLRTYYWIRPLIDQADISRRSAEDALFIGSSKALADAGTAWKAAEANYTGGAKQGTIIAEALAVRDRAWAELPYLAEWYSRRLSPFRINEGGLWDEQIRGLLLPAISDAHDLGALIENSLAATELASIATKTAELRTKCEELTRRFENYWNKTLNDKAENEETLHDILGLLQCPLIPASQRRGLRYKAAKIALTLYDEVRSVNAAEAEARKPDEKPAFTYLARQTEAWDKHPAIAILSRETFALDRASPQRFRGAGDSTQREEQLLDVSEDGEEIRHSLRSMWKAVDGWLTESDVALKSESLSELEAARLRGAADRLLRSGAVLSLDRPRRDPTIAVQELDLHNLMAWYAARTLQDFWGPVQKPGEAYFAGAGARFLNAANTFIAAGSSLQVGADRKLWDELKRLERVSNDVVDARTSNLFRADAQKKRKIEAAVAPGLPPGRAAVWLFDPQGGSVPVRAPGSGDSLSEIVRLPLDVEGAFGQAQGPRREELPFYFDLEALTRVGPRLRVASLYRGHYTTNQFLLESHEGIGVEYTPPPTLPALLTVRGEVREGGSVMFVLDSSMSMSEQTPVESPESSGGAPATKERLLLAKKALSELLDRLSREKDFRVGVAFYGHRVGYNLDNKDEILTQTDYEARRIPADLLPAEDVEVVWKVGHYGQQQNSVTNQLLGLLKPWGETPLYRSIDVGLKQFGGEDFDRRKSLVVITDGVDNVWQPANSPAGKVTKEQVLAEVRRRRIPIYILGFGIAADERARAQRDFNEIASASGGQYFEVNDAATLALALSQSLGPGVFSLDVHGSDRHVAEGLIGRSIELPVQTGRREEYDVRMQVGDVRASTRVTLVGGEAIEMYWNDSDKRLEFHRYLEGRPKFSKPFPNDPTAETRYILGAHLPVWNGPQLTFPVSLQNAKETEFSLPPAEAWVEITPMLPQGAGDPLVFYDLTLEPGKPAPVLACRADGWPLDARAARIHAWWKYETTRPDQMLTIADLTSSDEPGTHATEIPGAPQVTYSVEVVPAKSVDEPLKVIVFETYVERATDLNQVKIEIDPPAASVKRRFDRENQITIHEFSFPGVDEALIKQHRVLVTRRSSLFNGAFQNVDPVKINVVTLPGVVR